MLNPDIPVLNSNLNEATRNTLLNQARDAKADRIWIALDRSSLFDRGDHLTRLCENLRFFEDHGFETGVWIQAFGFGEPLSYEKCGWTRLRSVTGISREADAFCPEDPSFTEAYLAWVRDIARLSPALIMLDDDLCLSVRPGIGCFCKQHMRLLENEVGKIEDPTKLFTGKKNQARDAWFRIMGNTMRAFCKKVRHAVDEINPRIRVGLCAGYTSWDIEGTDPIELSKILAGGTHPFFRLTGAPYWVAPGRNRFPGQRLSAVIENARNQLAWSKRANVEFFAEADSYPRPAYHTPAMLIENFDLAMHASGVKSLKYLFDYYSLPEYETQYLKIHTRNIPLYEKIESAFQNTTPCGIRVYRPPHRITDAILPEEFVGEKPIMRTYFSKTAAMLACHAIPVSYEGENTCAAVFGDDALYLDDPSKKIVLDRTAALILKEKGIDVGFEPKEATVPPTFELFGENRVLLQSTDREAAFFDLKLHDQAIIKSRFDTGAAASFEYKNFLILNFDAFSVGEASSLYCSYARGKQLQEFFGTPYPAIPGFANLYSVCAERKNAHVVFFQNLSIDPVFDFDIVLPKACRAFNLTGAKGTLIGNKIHVTTEFAPQATVLLEVEYV
ncbi:MAG: hypothetical protein E7637_03980 [Ruminococcaceae bacterium]|nr:hypothetical protein [Oscillospiraceae bacterium]